MATTASPHPPDNPAEAAPPGTAGPTRVYEGAGIRVLWNATRCIHVANCLRAAPQVFNVNRRPWVEVDAADAETVAAAVLSCPTGALRYEPKGDLAPETPPERTRIRVQLDGALEVHGAVRLTDFDGRVVAEEYRVALCRCGASENKPFCDNSHRRVGFRG